MSTLSLAMYVGSTTSTCSIPMLLPTFSSELSASCRTRLFLSDKYPTRG